MNNHWMGGQTMNLRTNFALMKENETLPSLQRGSKQLTIETSFKHKRHLLGLPTTTKARILCSDSI
jgi:hypothetical protein